MIKIMSIASDSKYLYSEYEFTKNGCGAMHPLSETSKCFINYSATIKEPVLDLGCAYGIATIEAAKAGALEVVGCDIEQKHLDILKERAIKAGVLSKIRLEAGKFPYKPVFEPNSFGAILVSLVLPYLTLEELDIGLEKIYEWLVPEGKLFISSYTIHLKEFDNVKFKQEYKKRVDNGIKWPGFFEDFNQFSTLAEENVVANVVPKKLHFFDIDPLVSALTNIGFKVETAKYLDGRKNYAVEETWHDGKEMLCIIAKK